MCYLWAYCDSIFENPTVFYRLILAKKMFDYHLVNINTNGKVDFENRIVSNIGGGGVNLRGLGAGVSLYYVFWQYPQTEKKPSHNSPGRASEMSDFTNDEKIAVYIWVFFVTKS